MLRLASRAALVSLLVLLTGCSSVMGPGTPVAVNSSGQLVPLVSNTGDPEDDIIGARESPKIIASYGGIYSDRPAEIMLAQIVGKLLTAADQPNTNFTVTILDTAEVNAFALPGGYIYVTRGILALANDESELAAVLAHEIGHVVLHHARARAAQARTTDLVDKVITVFGSDPSTDQSANKAKLSFAAFSQAQELAADKKGIEIAGKAGFDPFAAARFLGAMGRFQQFSQGDADQVDDFLSSHPSTPDRIQKATEAARGMFGAPGIGVSNRSDYMAAVDGIIFGDSPAQGTITGHRFINANQKFTFTVPDGYNLQISKGAVVGVAGDGEAVRFDSADVSQTTALADYLKSGWIAGLKPETITTGNVNGFDTASGVAATDQWNFRVEIVRYGGQVYRFIFAARIDSDLFAKGADATLKSFRATNGGDVRSVRTLEVKSVTAGPVDSADSLARKMASLPNGTNLFYVLNNLYPGDPVTPGQPYKIVALN